MGAGVQAAAMGNLGGKPLTLKPRMEPWVPDIAVAGTGLGDFLKMYNRDGGASWRILQKCMFSYSPWVLLAGGGGARCAFSVASSQYPDLFHP